MAMDKLPVGGEEVYVPFGGHISKPSIKAPQAVQECHLDNLHGDDEIELYVKNH